MPLRRRVGYFHKRAKEMRAAACDASRSQDNRRTLLYFAEDYDEFAEEAARTEAEAGGPPTEERR